MREIKFRVWDNDYKRMHIVGDSSHDTLTCWNGEVQYYNLQNGEGSGEYGSYILMQYTGLKDKNGKEICEGDIVTLYCQENRGEWKDFDVTGTVTYFADPAQFLVKRENSHPQLGFDLFEMCHHPDYELLEMEVIGNIYENPELLEGEK
ncbi:YopX family protein [Niallia sp. Krafla_26]|uniref:YopX family protein n=1 Tax=Niallia sp. Krafla_26 TaxID=3064703 RepID=UPI003D16BCCA